MKKTAGWCRECDRAVWLPHAEHEDALMVKYDSGRRPLLPLRKPGPPSVFQIKQYRCELASDRYSEGSPQEAIIVLEGLLTFIGRESAESRERALDHTILADLAEHLMEAGEYGKAVAVLNRSSFEPARFDGAMARCLGLRGICLARTGRRAEAMDDYDRLYAQDTQHPLLGVIDREMSQGGPSGGAAPVVPDGPASVVNRTHSAETRDPA
jgi:hypothetical protein